MTPAKKRETAEIRLEGEWAVESRINPDQNQALFPTDESVPIAWHDVRRAPFKLYGLYQPQNGPIFRRLPADVAHEVSEKVERLGQECPGGRVRFATDSPYIAISARFRSVGRSSHMTMVSTAGFDLYCDGEWGSRYIREFRMPHDMPDSYAQIIHLPRGGLRAYTVHFPLHSVVETLQIGLKPGAVLKEGPPYRPLKPLVIYGSSIVHGVAASRPGLCYGNILSRMLNIDHTNFGFSGSAKGEARLARYMAQCPMSVFISDYDHNSPDPEHLRETHYPIYQIIREKNERVPYIMVTRPNYWTSIEQTDAILARRDVILQSYIRARDAGDKNVYLIDGMSFFADRHMYDYTVDHVHPNDAGFLRMAEAIGAVVRFAFERGAEQNG